MHLEQLLAKALEQIESDSFPSHINKSRALEVISALRGLLTEYGTTLADEKVLNQIGVLATPSYNTVNPAAVSILLSIPTATAPFADTPANQSGIQSLLYSGLIDFKDEHPCGYEVTDAGKQLIIKLEAHF